MVQPIFHRPKQVELIQQKGKSDCGIACMAMLTNKLYDDIVKLYPNLKYMRGGIYPEQVFTILDDLNYDHKTVDRLPKKGVALIAVQWKDQNVSGHFVVWDSNRQQFLDPKYGIINKRDMLKVANIEHIWRIWRTK